MFGCEAETGENETESKQICDCLNECEVTSFATAISAGKLSANVILEEIAHSSDISDRFIAALETRHRVVEPLMMTTVLQLKAAIEAYKQMQFRVNTKIIDVRTSWATAMSKLFTSLGNMVRGHIDDSLTLLDILSDVYSEHVDYLVTGLSFFLEQVDGTSANAHITYNIVHKLSSSHIMSTEQRTMLGALRTKLQEALDMTRIFEDMLKVEALDSPHQWQYFPNPLRVGDCHSAFQAVMRSLQAMIAYIDHYNIGGSYDDGKTINTLRSGAVSTNECLLSYKQKLLAFKSELDSQLTALSESEFSYDNPESSMLNFMLAGHWLQSITRQYLTGSLSKRELAEALHRNGSDVLDAAERLYSDIELSLFTKVSNEVDKQETEMVLFYSSVLRRVSELESYMYENDTSLEDFMRGFSIWRMPIVNYQTSQVRRFTRRLCPLPRTTDTSLKRSATECFVLRRQKPGIVFRQK